MRSKLHLAFQLSLVFKGAFAAFEVAAGLLSYLVTPQFVFSLVQAITRTELSEDPRDFVATRLLQGAQDLSLSSQQFAGFYLLSHGILKLWLIAGLWRGRIGYYRVAIGVFSLFIVYQCYRYTLTHSSLLLLITFIDAVVIWLTWAEYRRLARAA